MSGFLSSRHTGLEPYVPGEQPAQGERFIKLNTNENPFPPPEAVLRAVADAASGLARYCDPEAHAVVSVLATQLGLDGSQIVVGNGSDEILEFIFRAFGDEERPAVFADITYGFYPVFAQACGVPYKTIPLREDFTLDFIPYGMGARKLFVFANPNAPTGIAKPASSFVSFAKANPGSIVVVDEAYVDFGAESCVPYLNEAENLLVVQTFSKSRSLAGARFGFAAGAPELIADLQAIRYASNPYNVNACTQAAACAMLACEDEVRARCAEIAETREETAAALKKLGFEVTDSRANFLFVRHPEWAGRELYERCRRNGILVRHFDADRIRDYLRITVGTKEQMAALTCTLRMLARKEGHHDADEA